MTPPVAPDRETLAEEGQPAASLRLETMKTRPEFLATARGLRTGSPGLNLQGRCRGDGGPVRVGFTATKKVGNAVARNRAKRRLRALAREVLNAAGRPGWDYVLVARPGTTATLPFDTLRRDLIGALDRLHGLRGS